MLKKGDIIYTCGLLAEVMGITPTYDILKIRYLQYKGDYDWHYNYTSTNNVIYADNKLIRTLYGLEENNE